ncbi:MAG: ATP-binding protein [Verrucomicrobiales bacterium]|nr:ATP-binding protein [Verrucomicrobiales bacterium]MCP5556337.1 ATP-binding protein [Verrucomicrobiaceae bacterium]
MATAEQIKSLIRSHLGEDDERFYTLALQVAAHEAQQGHVALAHDIREIVDKSRKARCGNVLLRFPQDMAGMVLSEQSDLPLATLVVTDEIRDRIQRIVHEHHQQEKLKKHGLSNRRKILLTGPPGTGKTLTAQVIAHELRLPLHTIQVDKLVTKFMGETSAKLRQIFDLIRDERGVYLFDEFDAIGGERSRDNDVGEMRRVLNALLQFIEQDASESLIIGATNNPSLLDRALFRRFDDVLNYTLPDAPLRRRLIGNVLGTFKGRLGWKSILAESEGLSHAELDHACRDAIKEAILNDQKTVETQGLSRMLRERSQTHERR